MRRSAIAIAVLSMAWLTPGAAHAAGDPADFAATVDGPASSSVGGVANYEVIVSNAGPGTEAAKVRLTRDGARPMSSRASRCEHSRRTPRRGPALPTRRA